MDSQSLSLQAAVEALIKLSYIHNAGVLAHVVSLCVADADIGTICEAGDKMIEEECAKVYKNPEKDAEGKKVQVAKGV